MVHETAGEADLLDARQACDRHGYPVIRVKTGDKKPVAQGWQNGDPLALTDASARNTGILMAGYRGIDIDTDDPVLAARLCAEARRRFGPTIVRGRANSPRCLLLYRASEGAPGKKSVVGTDGKVEVLGAGQHAVAYGTHTSGSQYEWEDGKGPHNTPRADIPAVTEAQIDDLLAWAGVQIGADNKAKPVQEGQATNAALPELTGALVGGPSALNAAAKAGGGGMGLWDVEDCLAHLPNAGPADWDKFNGVGMEIYVATGGSDAGRQMYEAWANQHPEANRGDTATARWASYDRSPPTRTGGGALVGRVRRELGDPNWTPDGYALMQRRGLVPPPQPNSPPAADGSTTVVTQSAAIAAPFFQAPSIEPHALHPTPWVIPGMVLRRGTTLIVGQGGSAKTTLAITLGVALAAGRSQVGPMRVNTRPGGLRVAVISGEEDANRFGLITAAACDAENLTPSERADMKANLVYHDAAASGCRIGEAAAGARETIAPEASDKWLAEIKGGITQHRTDVLIIDTAAALLAVPNENDNNAVTAIMTRLTRLARAHNCAVVLLHHTPKMTRESAASMRGEPTMVRGGGAFANSARAVVSIAPLSAEEQGQVALLGRTPDSVRRIDTVKCNDAPSIQPVIFSVTSRLVRVSDGSDHSVRAIEFLPPLPSATTGIPDAVRNLVMKTVEDGARDPQGGRVPLSLGGGRVNGRAAIPAVADALVSSCGMQPGPASGAAREVLKDLMRIGCVTEQVVRVPRYKPDGHPNGTREVRGLVCHWNLAPWRTQPAVGAAQSDLPDRADVPDAATDVAP